MQPSMFNLRVALAERNEVFLMNTLTDAQLVVSPDVAALLDRFSGEAAAREGAGGLTDEERQSLEVLQENGFLVENREDDRRRLDRHFARVMNDSSELHVTV